MKIDIDKQSAELTAAQRAWAQKVVHWIRQSGEIFQVKSAEEAALAVENHFRVIGCSLVDDIEVVRSKTEVQEEKPDGAPVSSI